MSALIRGLLGAALASTVILVANPISRPYVVSAWVKSDLGAFDSLPGQVPKIVQLDSPHDPLATSVWFQAACQRLVNKKVLSSAELEDTQSVIQAAIRSEPENAYWRQAAAVIAFEQEKPAAVLEELRKASGCTMWNDYQSPRLRSMQSSLTDRFGARQAWQAARVYWLRDLQPVLAIDQVCRRMLEIADLETPNGRLIRYIVIRNADLIRGNSRSLASGMIASNLIESGVRNASDRSPSSQRRILLQRDRLCGALLNDGNKAYADALREVFSQTDSWQAVVAEPKARQNIEVLSYLSILTGSFSGGLFASSGIGLFLWGLGMSLREGGILAKSFALPIVLVVGFLMMLGTLAFTQAPLLAVSIGIVAAVVGISPRRFRTNPTEVVTPFFSRVANLLAALFLVLLSVYFAARTTAAEQVLDGLSLREDSIDYQRVLLSVSILLSACLLGLAPFWAHLRKIRTQVVLSNGMVSFGSAVAVLGMIAGVVACPLLIYADRRLGSTLYQLVGNEPYYYYLKR